MNPSMEFKLDLGDTVQPLYAAVPGVAFSLGNTEVAFHVHADGAVHVMSAEVERALAQCRSFRTLDEHVAAIVQRNPALSEKRAAVRGVLEHLTRLGVLVPGRDLIARLTTRRGSRRRWTAQSRTSEPPVRAAAGRCSRPTPRRPPRSRRRAAAVSRCPRSMRIGRARRSAWRPVLRSMR